MQLYSNGESLAPACPAGIPNVSARAALVVYKPRHPPATLLIAFDDVSLWLVRLLGGVSGKETQLLWECKSKGLTRTEISYIASRHRPESRTFRHVWPLLCTSLAHPL